MKHNRELGAYQKMILLLFELNSNSSDALPIKATTMLKKINKYWMKYHAKEFREKGKK